jgi:hypothetical protein
MTGQCDACHKYLWDQSVYDRAEEWRKGYERMEHELMMARAEAQRLRVILRQAYDCLPDMPAVCCQTVQLAVDGGKV